jgi:hypothetical protein
VSYLRRFIEFDRFAHDPDDLPPVADWHEDGSAMYEVEYIMMHRMHRNKLQYLIKWYNYDKQDATWEPSESIAATAPDAVADYHRRHPNVPTSAAQQSAAPASTEQRHRDRRPKASTATNSGDTTGVNRRSERLQRAHQHESTANTLALHMLQLYVTI